MYFGYISNPGERVSFYQEWKAQAELPLDGVFVYGRNDYPDRSHQFAFCEALLSYPDKKFCERLTRNGPVKKLEPEPIETDARKLLAATPSDLFFYVKGFSPIVSSAYMIQPDEGDGSVRILESYDEAIRAVQADALAKAKTLGVNLSQYSLPGKPAVSALHVLRLVGGDQPTELHIGGEIRDADGTVLYRSMRTDIQILPLSSVEEHLSVPADCVYHDNRKRIPSQDQPWPPRRLQ